MWILAKPLTCRSNTNSGPLHSRIHGLALRLKGNSSMNSPRKTNPRPQSKLWTWKSETWALQIKFLLVKKSMRSSVVTLKGTFIFFHGGTSPGGRAKAWIHSQESAHGHQWPVPKVWTTEAERQQVFPKHVQCNHRWCNSSARTVCVRVFKRESALYVS